MSDRPMGREALPNGPLMRYVAVLASGMIAVQGYAALATGSRITLVPTLLLLAVALYSLVFYLRNRRALRQRAYAGLVVHLLTYAVVVGSYGVHALALVLAGRADVLAVGWPAFVLGMAALWGVGLVVHVVGALRSAGYDDVAV